MLAYYCIVWLVRCADVISSITSTNYNALNALVVLLLAFPQKSGIPQRRKLCRELLHRIQRLCQVRYAKRFSTAKREALRGAARVLDLPSVGAALREHGHKYLHICDTSLAKEGAPDLRLRVLGELVKVERDVDAREEGLVEGLDAVRGEEEDAAVVLDVAQEDGDHRIPLEIVQ